MFLQLFGIALGTVAFILFSSLGLKILGIVVLVIISLISFAIGALKIPDVAMLTVTRKIGGEHLDEIILRYFKFKKKRKLYSIAVEKGKGDINGDN